MVIAPGFSHSLRLSVVWDYVAVIRELLVANYALSALLSDLPIEHLPHLGWRPEFPVSPRVMWILDTLNAEAQSPFHLGLLTATTEKRVVNWAVLILSEFHIIPSMFSGYGRQ
jgi:hypothetical protein